jgi:hypothetical protein
VRSPSNQVHYGNELFATSETYKDYAQADDFNNVERVVYPPFVTPGQYIVRVTAPRVPTGSQMLVSPHPCMHAYMHVCKWVCLPSCESVLGFKEIHAHPQVACQFLPMESIRAFCIHASNDSLIATAFFVHASR